MSSYLCSHVPGKKKKKRTLYNSKRNHKVAICKHNKLRSTKKKKKKAGQVKQVKQMPKSSWDSKCQPHLLE